MKKEYKVRFFQNDIYEVIEIITKYGERTTAYDSRIKVTLVKSTIGVS